MSSTDSITPRTRGRVASVTLKTESSAPSITGVIKTDESFYQATMSPEKFAEFLTHPRQRDTERHALIAVKRHLKEFSVTQASVSAAQFEGRFYKLDGHTRSMLWATGKLPKPEKVTVTIYNCTTWEQLLSLYNNFDNKYAAENGGDQLSGAMREAGIEVTSQMFRNYKFLSALKRAWAACSVTRGSYADRVSSDLLVRQVKFFENEIKWLDSVDPSLRIFRTGVAAGAFIALKKRGEAVLPFFRLLNENGGVQGNGECDGVQALHNIIMSTNLGTHRDTWMVMSRTISCVEAWRSERPYSLSRLGAAGVKQTDLSEYTKGLMAKGADTDGIAKVRVRPARGAIERVLPASL